MENLSHGLSLIGQKVDELKPNFELSMKDATQIKIDLDRKMATIAVAGTLVDRLRGEYDRWQDRMTALEEELRQMESGCFKRLHDRILLISTLKNFCSAWSASACFSANILLFLAAFFAFLQQHFWSVKPQLDTNYDWIPQLDTFAVGYRSWIQSQLDTAIGYIFKSTRIHPVKTLA
uniref:Uncharacterized protein n=1 Tax=Ditylenchus dipsaci TaxID=166011 RepID=A0A915E5A3_9BILA